jgi:hypothetical protein
MACGQGNLVKGRGQGFSPNQDAQSQAFFDPMFAMEESLQGVGDAVRADFGVEATADGEDRCLRRRLSKDAKKMSIWAYDDRDIGRRGPEV